MGRTGEQAVCKYLKKKGYKILETNYKTPFGEADIIAFKEGIYCFVEVKTREGDAFGLPSEAVDERKRARYRKIAWCYCKSKKEELYCRFDVASVYQKEIEYFENAYI